VHVPVIVHLSLQVLLIFRCLLALKRDVVFHLSTIELMFVGVNCDLCILASMAKGLWKLCTPLNLELSPRIFNRDYHALEEISARVGVLIERGLCLRFSPGRHPGFEIQFMSVPFPDVVVESPQ